MSKSSIPSNVEKYIWGSVKFIVNKYPFISEFYSEEDLFQEGVLVWLKISRVEGVRNKFKFWSKSYTNRILEIVGKLGVFVSYDAYDNDEDDNNNYENILCSHFLDEHKRRLLNLIIANTTEKEREEIISGQRWTIRRVRKRLGLPEVFEGEITRKKIYTTNPKNSYSI